MQTITMPDDATFAATAVDPDAWAIGSEQPGQDPDTVSCTIYPEQTWQTIDGIGGSFSEVGADYLHTLPEDLRHQALGRLFDPADGGFTWCRMPMGASDFGRDAYSLADTAEDFGLEHFSIERDRAGILAFIQAARRWQPDLHIHASPWSPPAWMKDNGSMVQGGSLRREPAVYQAYADYFVRFVQAYRAEGVDIARVCQQNEPDVPTPYPSCVMLPDQMVPWTVEHLAPAFAAAGLSTEIWGGTFRMVGGLQSHECLASEAFRQAVAGVGFQYSFHEPLRDLGKRYPGLRLMHTESVCHDGSNSWLQAAMLFEDVLNYLRDGCGLYTYWNMVLDQTGLSTWGWRQNSLLTIDTDAGTVRDNPDLAVMKLFSRHLLPGSVRLEAFSFQKPVLAIRRPDGVVVCFVGHHGERPMAMRLRIDDREERFELAPRSLNAFTL